MLDVFLHSVSNIVFRIPVGQTVVDTDKENESVVKVSGDVNRSGFVFILSDNFYIIRLFVFTFRREVTVVKVKLHF